jgi:predicted RNA-binding protein with RPS1 domain
VWRFVKLQKVKISQFGAFAKLQKAKSHGLVPL